jgi:integrase
MAKLVAAKLHKLPAGLHGDGGGLYLQVTKGGAKSWVFRFMLHGRARSMGLGPLYAVSLAKARIKAGECRRLRYEGVDPIEARRNERAGAASVKTFRECAEAYLVAHADDWSNAAAAAQWSSSLAVYVYPTIGALPVQVIDVERILKVLKPIWNTKPETARRIRGRIESILDYAATLEYRSGENPARWKGHLANLLSKRSKIRRHHPALPYVELSAFMATLRAQESVAARALEFAILTAARTGEVIGARWAEIDLIERMWTIPAERMKSRKEHRVPLSAPAIAILEQLPRVSDFIFPGNRPRQPIGVTTIFKLLRRMGRGDVTAHGFRSTFADWAAEQTNAPHEIREMALAHAVGSKVEAAYRRSDLFEKRRELAEAWARFCAGGDRSEVIELRHHARGGQT